MAWIAIADSMDPRFSCSGLGSDAGRSETSLQRDDPLALLTRGTLLMEARLAPDGRPQTLLEWDQAHPWRRGLSLRALPGGGIALVVFQGNDACHCVVKHDATGGDETLRISYSWDAPARWGRLVVEKPNQPVQFMTELSDPPPLPLGDVHAVTMMPAMRSMDPEVTFFAISTRIEPVGPLPTLDARVPLCTPYGYKPLGQVKRGDVMRLADGTTQPVLHVLRRTVPARGFLRPVRLRAPYFGLQQDIVVAPEQMLVIGGSDVEYLFDEEFVLVPARHLVNGTAAHFCATGPTATYGQVLLPAHEAILAAGTPMESLFIGRIRRNHARLAASLLAGIERSRLPDHAASAYPVLRAYEAITLSERRAA
ncbi:MAG: Hint domain-containing protein [Rhodobacterales bacterium]|nr:Hint domain-containing protein [Rhodobacterales bacterium]MDX5390766.1 Hint domain-containing protein [Rhodobacterales bacterium]MDX5490467.1 Hint domain-containing protein [Rhodobacterales bacterium]